MGSKFLNKLSNEISSEFPTAKGFSVRNLKNMVRFYREYPEIKIVQSVTAQITWTHNIEILRVESKEQRLWYINITIENGTSEQDINERETVLNVDKEYYKAFGVESMKNYFWQLGRIIKEQLKENRIFNYYI